MLNCAPQCSSFIVIQGLLLSEHSANSSNSHPTSEARLQFYILAVQHYQSRFCGIAQTAAFPPLETPEYFPNAHFPKDHFPKVYSFEVYFSKVYFPKGSHPIRKTVKKRTMSVRGGVYPSSFILA